MTTSVLLVDDVPELRGVVRQALRAHGGFEVVGEAGDGAGAVAAAAEHHPDIVVLDLGLPDLAGEEVVSRLRRVAPAAAVVIYTGTADGGRSPLGGEVAAFVHKDQGIRYLVELLAGLGRRPAGAVLELAARPTAVSEARRFLRDLCRDWGRADLVDDATLVLSELVTNAIVHGGTGCRVAAGLEGDKLRLEVTDTGGGAPDLQAPASFSEHGRGLLLVSALSMAWGVESTSDGAKTVWAELVGAPTAQHEAV